MAGYLIVLAIALLPIAGSVIGAVIAETTRASQKAVGAALHAAAGIAIALVSVNLMPRILQDTPVWAAVAAFLGGAAFSVLVAAGVKRLEARTGTGGSAGAWMVYVAIAADLFSDGLMTGVGSAVSSSLGLLLGLSQVVGNIPGGFAAVANFRSEGVARRKRVIIACSFALPILAAASAGYWLLRHLGPEAQNAALAFIVGILLLATVEDTLPQGDEPSPPRLVSTISFAGGFAFFVLLASYLG